MIYEKAYAKINFALAVGKEQNGYHEVKNLMVPIDLYDELFFQKSQDIKIDCEVEIKENICLKAIEGTAKSMGVMLSQEIKSSFGGKIGYLFMRKNLKRFKKRMSTKEVGGAMLFGLSKIVVKAHGNSDPVTYGNAICLAYDLVKANIIQKVVDQLPENKE